MYTNAHDDHMHHEAHRWHRPSCMPYYEPERDDGIETVGRYVEMPVTEPFVLGLQLGHWELGGELDCESRRDCAGQRWRFTVRFMAEWLRFREESSDFQVDLVRRCFERELMRLDASALATALVDRRLNILRLARSW